VAVKIINHDKHVGNHFDALRESVLCSNIQHPNVVMTYKVRSATKHAPATLHQHTQANCMQCEVCAGA